jgi:hypothetical protein
MTPVEWIFVSVLIFLMLVVAPAVAMMEEKHDHRD